MRRGISLLGLIAGLALLVIAGPRGEVRVKSGQWVVQPILDLGPSNAVGQTSANNNNSDNGADAQAINQAIQDLTSLDSFTVRASLRTIGNLANTSGIQRAVEPIEPVLLNHNNQHGMVTRSLAAHALGQVIRYIDNNGIEDHALEILIQALQDDPIDRVRASAAIALGNAGNTNAIEMLEYSMQNDPSLLVQLACAQALFQLGNISLTPQTQAVTSVSALSTNAMINGEGSSSAYTAPTEKEIVEYLNQHSLVPITYLPFPE